MLTAWFADMAATLVIGAMAEQTIHLRPDSGALASTRVVAFLHRSNVYAPLDAVNCTTAAQA
jgi:hypothetical protein